MSPRVALVVGTAATQSPDVLAARLRGLLRVGWDARLLGNGEGWAGHPAWRDPALADRVEHVPPGQRRLPPRPLLRRPAGLAGYLGAPGEPGPFDRRLLELRPDLVHFHSGATAWKAMRLKRLLGCRVAISFREDGHDLDNHGLEALWEGAELLLFPDAAVLERAVALGCRRERAEVLPAPLWA
nr:glycosyltransferase [Actinomycetota bacterium]